MTTKYPVTDNKVTNPPRGRALSGDRSQRGIALITVIAVLVLLMIVATPFLLAMRDSARRGEEFLYSVRVDAEADALYEQVRARLVQNIEYIERRKLDAASDGSAAKGNVRSADDATPTSDTMSELTMPPEILAEFNKLSGQEHRLWGVDVVDTQSRFNLNNCSYLVLSNLLGRADITADIEATDERIEISDGSAFPKSGGVVRIGNEAIKYTAVEGSLLVGCERGYKSTLGNGGSAAHTKGSIVVDEAAFQIAMRPILARPPARVRYTNIYEARAISDQGITTLSPDRFDSMRRFVTAWSGGVVGDGWSNPQNLRANISASDSGDRYADIKNVRYFGVGTMVMVTDGVNRDYGVVVEVRGTNQVAVSGKFNHDYLADQARIYGLARSPLNVNTADEETLTMALWGLRLRGKGTSVGRETAKRLAQYLKQAKNPAEKELGVYRTWEDFTKALDAARQAGVIDLEQNEAVLRNALNANDSTLEFSTVPFCFRSFDVYEARATAVLLDGQGAELKRRELHRVFDVGSARSGTNVIETQADFQEQIRLSRDSKWFATYPKNVNAYYDDVNIPASEYRAYAESSRFPDTDRSPTVGHIQLAPASFRYTGQNRFDRYIHFDEQEDPEGIDLSQQALSVSVDGPYSAKDKKAELTRFADVPPVGENIELGLAPFSCSFWYRPGWDRNDKTERIIFDYGSQEAHQNRVSLRHDPVRGVLVLACADASREARSAEIRYDYDTTTWTTDQWYHIACTVYGCSPELMELFIDGDKRGKATLLTRTVSTVPPTGDISRIDVTSGFAEDFPPTGVLLMHGTEGVELFEYGSHDNNGFNITRRKARSIDGNTSPSPNRTHPAGASISLYGFSAPLLTDIRRGGATLDSQVGPFRVFRAHGTDEYLASGTDSAGNSINVGVRGIANIDGFQSIITLTEWDTGAADQTIMAELGPQGSTGIAMLASTVPGLPAGTFTTALTGASNGNTAATANGLTAVGGVDIVAYTVGSITSTGVTVTLNQRGQRLRHYDASQVNQPSSGSNPGRFFPCYDYGYDIAATQHPFGSQYARYQPTGAQYGGVITAFIPLGIVASGSGADYLDPADQEAQLSTTNGGAVVPGFAFVQVDSEWIKYDTFDTGILSGKSVFYRDQTLANLSALIDAQNAALITVTVPTPGMSAGIGGGAGNGTNTEPPVATDLNTTQYAPAVPSGQSLPIPGTSVTEQPPARANVAVTTQILAAAADCRGWQDDNQQLYQRIANTYPASHAQGTNVIPCFALAAADLDFSDAARGAYAGFNDLITLRDRAGHDEQIRLQWGARVSAASAGLQYQVWAAATQPLQNLWRWDRPTDTVDLRRYPTQSWTRAIKFPSGEMPDNKLTENVEQFRFGVRFDDAGGTTPAFVDELGFQPLQFPAATDRPDYAELGEVPSQVYNPQSAPAGTQAPPLAFASIDANTDTISVHRMYWVPASRSIASRGLGIPSEVFRADGGCIRIEDELIFYSDFDAANGTFTGCQRGVFGTTANSHGYGALVFPVESFPMSRLESSADTQSAAFTVADGSDFPDNGYLRIQDSNELALYTQISLNDLSGPLARIDPAQIEGEASNEKKRSGGALFRGRYATTPTGYNQGDIVVAMPYRYYDRYSERSDDPENSYTQFSWTKRGAIWKRVSWDQLPRNNIDVLALVRFQGGPEWDADKVIRVGQDGIPKENRNAYLYEISKPDDLNLLNVESDRIEVRMLIRYAQGSYLRLQGTDPDGWKQTPEIRKLTVEFVAPTTVLNQE